MFSHAGPPPRPGASEEFPWPEIHQDFHSLSVDCSSFSRLEYSLSQEYDHLQSKFTKIHHSLQETRKSPLPGLPTSLSPLKSSYSPGIIQEFLQFLYDSPAFFSLFPSIFLSDSDRHWVKEFFFYQFLSKGIRENKEFLWVRRAFRALIQGELKLEYIKSGGLSGDYSGSSVHPLNVAFSSAISSVWRFDFAAGQKRPSVTSATPTISGSKSLRLLVADSLLRRHGLPTIVACFSAPLRLVLQDENIQLDPSTRAAAAELRNRDFAAERNRATSRVPPLPQKNHIGKSLKSPTSGPENSFLATPTSPSSASAIAEPSGRQRFSSFFRRQRSKPSGSVASPNDQNPRDAKNQPAFASSLANNSSPLAENSFTPFSPSLTPAKSLNRSSSSSAAFASSPPSFSGFTLSQSPESSNDIVDPRLEELTQAAEADLLAILQRFLEAIKEAERLWPISFLELLADIFSSTASAYGRSTLENHEKHAILLRVVYEILIFPALRRPALSGLYLVSNPKSRSLQNLELVLLALENLLSGQTFAASHVLAPCNRWLSKHFNTVQKHFEALYDRIENETGKNDRQQPQPEAIFPSVVSATGADLQFLYSILTRPLSPDSLSDNAIQALQKDFDRFRQVAVACKAKEFYTVELKKSKEKKTREDEKPAENPLPSSPPSIDFLDSYSPGDLLSKLHHSYWKPKSLANSSSSSSSSFSEESCFSHCLSLLIQLFHSLKPEFCSISSQNGRRFSFPDWLRMISSALERDIEASVYSAIADSNSDSSTAFPWDSQSLCLALTKELQEESGKFQKLGISWQKFFEEAHTLYRNARQTFDRQWRERERRLRSAVEAGQCAVQQLEAEWKHAKSILDAGKFQVFCMSSHFQWRVLLPASFTPPVPSDSSPSQPRVFFCTSVESFIDEFLAWGASFRRDSEAAGRIYHAFIKLVEKHFLDSEIAHSAANAAGISSASPASAVSLLAALPLSQILNALESYIIIRIYHVVLPLNNSVDEFLVHLDDFSSFKPEDFDFPPSTPARDHFWTRPVTELQRINEFRSPHEKMRCLVRTVKWLAKSLSLQPKSRSIDADQSLSALIYAILLARPSRLVENLAFIERFSQPAHCTGEGGYCLTQLATAVEYIKQLKPGKTENSREKAGSATSIAASIAQMPTRASPNLGALAASSMSLSSSSALLAALLDSSSASAAAFSTSQSPLDSLDSALTIRRESATQRQPAFDDPPPAPSAIKLLDITRRLKLFDLILSGLATSDLLICSRICSQWRSPAMLHKHRYRAMAIKSAQLSAPKQEVNNGRLSMFSTISTPAQRSALSALSATRSVSGQQNNAAANNTSHSIAHFSLVSGPSPALGSQASHHQIAAVPAVGISYIASAALDSLTQVSADSSPAPKARRFWDPLLDSADPSVRLSLLRFCESRFCDEWLLFYWDVQLYKSLSEGSDYLFGAALLLNQKFLVPGCEWEIGGAGDEREKIRAVIKAEAERRILRKEEPSVEDPEDFVVVAAPNRDQEIYRSLVENAAGTREKPEKEKEIGKRGVLRETGRLSFSTAPLHCGTFDPLQDRVYSQLKEILPIFQQESNGRGR